MTVSKQAFSYRETHRVSALPYRSLQQNTVGGTAYVPSFTSTSTHAAELINDTNIKNNGRRPMHNVPLATKETVSAFINDYQTTCAVGAGERC